MKSINNIKIAYLLLVHDNLEQLNMFINQALNYGNCDVYIHVDRKNESMAGDIVKNSHVYVISTYEVSWASFSMINATIALAKEVIASREGYTHIYYGSGDDLLVKNGLYEYLAEHPLSSFMQLYWGGEEITNKNRASARYRMNFPQWLKTRHDYHPARFIRILLQILCVYGIVLFPNRISIDHLKLKIFCGSQWFITPYEVMVYCIEYIDNHPEYISFWENALAPDEFFFQTLIMNSKYKNFIEPQLMFHKAGNTFGTKNHPLTITKNMVEEIKKGQFFCARKFSLKNYPDVINYYLGTVNDGYHINR